MLSWAEAYFFWTAFVWMAYQLIGRNPDFRKLQTWGRYGVFVVLIMLFDPIMWGYICSPEYTAAAYSSVSPTLAFTLSITWILGPPAFLVALPLVRRLGWFWAEIPGHVREAQSVTASGSGKRAGVRAARPRPADALPIRVFIFTPFIALVLVMVGATAIVALRAPTTIRTGWRRFQQEASANIGMRLDKYPPRLPTTPAQRRDDLARLLGSQAINPMAGPSFPRRQTQSSLRRLPKATRSWGARFRLWRSHRSDCPERPGSSASITSELSRRLAKHGWPTRRRTMAETDPGFW